MRISQKQLHVSTSFAADLDPFAKVVRSRLVATRHDAPVDIPYGARYPCRLRGEQKDHDPGDIGG